jgi:phosphoesterase RecJ-like protein
MTPTKKGHEMNNDGMSEVIDAIKKGDNFLLAAHVNPEGDSIGSQLAMYHLLKKLGKNAVIVNHDRVPENLNFLPGAADVKTELPEDFKPSVALVLDCPVMVRVGTVIDHLNEIGMIVNIDHHISNEYYGDVNWVDAEASSAGEMIYRLAREMKVDVDKDMATDVYAAMVTDTGMFSYDNTTDYTHVIAAELMRLGVSPKKMFSEIYEKRSAAQVKLLGKALATLKMEENGQLAHITLTRDMVIDEGIKGVSTDEFINYPRSVKGIKVAVFFKESVENAGTVNVSFRSTGDINVDEIASRFGGGGHQKASGCVIKEPLGPAKEMVLTEVRKILNAEGK